MKNTLENQENCDTYIGLTLTELIDNNTKILENRIQETNIKSIITGMRFETTNLYFIDLLRAICICEGKPMFKNQKIITQLLFNEDTYRDRGFSFLTDENNQVIVQSSRNEREKQLKFIRNLISLEENDELKRLPFVVNFCELISDLCKERNYLAINFV